MNSDLSGPIYAKVSDNKDPVKLGRVKVLYKFLGDNVESDWLNVLNIFGGTFYIPEIDSQVVVAFIGGNPQQGLVLGNIWTNAQKPPASGENAGSEMNKDGKNNLRYFITKGGNKLLLDDTDGTEKIQLINANGKNRLEFMANEKTIRIKSKEKIIIDAGKNLSLTAESALLEIKKGFTVKAKEITLESKSELNVKTSKEIQIEGNSTALN